MLDSSAVAGPLAERSNDHSLQNHGLHSAGSEAHVDNLATQTPPRLHHSRLQHVAVLSMPHSSQLLHCLHRRIREKIARCSLEKRRLLPAHEGGRCCVRVHCAGDARPCCRHGGAKIFPSLEARMRQRELALPLHGCCCRPRDGRAFECHPPLAHDLQKREKYQRWSARQ